MSFFSRVQSRSVSAKVQEAAPRLAEELLDTMWAKVHPRVLQMGPAEARGYVLARTNLSVRDRVAAEVAAMPAAASKFEAALVQMTSERVVELVRRRVLHALNASIRRKAA